MRGFRVQPCFLHFLEDRGLCHFLHTHAHVTHVSDMLCSAGAGKGGTSPSATNKRRSRTRKHRCTRSNKHPARAQWSAPPVRQRRGLPCDPQRFPDRAGRDHRTSSTAAPSSSSHALPPPPIPPPAAASPPTSRTASQRAGQQPSEEAGRMRGDGRAVSRVNAGPLPAVMDRQLAVTPSSRRSKRSLRRSCVLAILVCVGYCEVFTLRFNVWINVRLCSLTALLMLLTPPPPLLM